MTRTRFVAILVVVACAFGAEADAQTVNAHRDALVGLARVRRDAGDPGGARRYFERAAGMAPLSPGEQAEYFWVLVDERPTAAIAIARQVLGASPADDRVRERAIAAAVVAGDERAVLDMAGEGRDRFPSDARWPRHLAESALRRRRASEAAQHYEAALAGRGAEDRDRAGLALAREAAGDPRRAMTAWQAVSAEVRASQPAWTASFLRVLATTAAPAEAAVAVDAWVRSRPNDDAMREMLVELWVRAGEPMRALAAVSPVASRPLARDAAAQRWTRREVDLAIEVEDRARAMRALDRLAAAHLATPADERHLVSLLVDAGESRRAAQRMGAWPCDDALFEYAARLPEREGTDVMRDAVRRGTGACLADGRGAMRTLDRLVAAGRHAEARTMVAALPADLRARPTMRRLAGQLALWTGDLPSAVAVLEPLRRETPDDRAVADALVDAYRGVGRAYDAWEVASVLVADGSLDVSRLFVLAEVALEADAPRDALALLHRSSAEGASAASRQALRARAMLALGRPGEARVMLAALNPADLTPTAALALIDSTIAIRGRDEALDVARRFASDALPWRNVFARRVLLETMAGTAEADALRARLASLDPALARVVEVEVALAREVPQEALAILRDASAESHRLADLRATAEGVSPQAIEILDRLRVDRPRFTPFAIRAADLAWRTTQSDDAFARLSALQQSMPEHEGAAVAVARALAVQGRHRDAVDLIARVTGDAEMTLDARAATAASERALAEEAADAARAPEVDGLARARLLASSARWPDALAAIDTVLAHDAHRLDGLRLRADVLSWAGDHDEAIEAFDRYLALAPLDMDARRQQARVTGWSGARAAALRRYASVVAAFPDEPALAAEAAAKAAFFEGHWHRAADRYRAWLALEPDNAEARFELAEVEQAAGHTAVAEVERAQLAARVGGHALATQARIRAALRAQPSATVTTEIHAANGYAGQRLLDVTASGGRVERTWGPDGGFVLSAEAARLTAVAVGDRLTGTRVALAAAWRGHALGVDVALGRSAYGGADRSLVEGVARLRWQPADRWSISAGAARQALLESLTSVARGLAVTGPFASATFASPTTSLEVRAMGQTLSDGNARLRVTMFATRAVSERWPGLRLVSWAEQLGYRDATTNYYSPQGVLHVDGGAEYTHAFSRARFRGDRERSVTAGYLVGIDTRGQVFHQPAARWSFEIGRGVVIDGRVSRIQSPDYRETTFALGLRLGGDRRLVPWRD